MLLTPKQAAQRLSVSPRTVYLWLEQGRLEHVRLSERVTRIPEAAVDEMIASGLVAAMHRRNDRTGGAGRLLRALRGHRERR